MSLLTGFRVVQIGQGLAAAVCGRLLADVGADVGCIEPDRSTLLTAYLNHGKRVVARDVLATADLIVCEGRPAELRSRQCDAEALHRLNAGAALVLISPFGQIGPRANDPASDLTLMYSSGIARLLRDRWTICRKRRSARWASSPRSSAGLPPRVPAC